MYSDKITHSAKLNDEYSNIYHFQYALHNLGQISQKLKLVCVQCIKEKQYQFIFCKTQCKSFALRPLTISLLYIELILDNTYKYFQSISVTD